MIEKAKQLVSKYVNDHLCPNEPIRITEDDVLVVWYCYILGNCKAMLTTKLPDGMYYEVTYNSDKDEIYLDAYKKWENQRIAADASDA
jgi:hypothetical protein